MQKKVIVCLIIFVILVGGGLFILLPRDNGNYIVKINKVDGNSPDRILKVFKDDEEIPFEAIYYLDEIFICDSTNPSVGKTAVNKEEKLKVKLKNNRMIVAKVVKEDE